MTIIERIKDELGKISPWPWEWECMVKSWPCALSGKGSQTDVLIPTQDAYDYCFVAISEVHKSFIAHSPERIALLLESCEAAAAAFSELKANNQLTSVRVETGVRYQKARAKLEAQDD